MIHSTAWTGKVLSASRILGVVKRMSSLRMARIGFQGGTTLPTDVQELRFVMAATPYTNSGQQHSDDSTDNHGFAERMVPATDRG